MLGVNNKDLVKSQKLVSKAVGVFSQAIAEVEKANGILIKSIETDNMTIDSLNKQIQELELKISDIKDQQKAKGEEIRANEALLENLKQFV